MDAIDSKLITLLSENANMTATEMSSIIGLSVPAINKRISRMVEAGIISRYTVMIDPDTIGKSLLAFMSVILERLSYIDHLMRCVNDDQDILECFAVAGEFDYILKIRAKNMLNLENKICKIKEVQGVVKTNTTIVLYTHKSMPSVLPDAIEPKKSTAGTEKRNEDGPKTGIS